MVNQVINGLIASVVGAVAYIAVSALVSSDIYGLDGNVSYGASEAAGQSTAGEMMIHDILPLAIAIMIIAGLFMSLTRVKGV